MSDFFEIETWPKQYRRWFLLMLPISGPLWLAAVAIMLVLCLLMVIVVAPVAWAVDLWNDNLNDKANK